MDDVYFYGETPNLEGRPHRWTPEEVLAAISRLPSDTPEGQRYQMGEALVRLANFQESGGRVYNEKIAGFMMSLSTYYLQNGFLTEKQHNAALRVLKFGDSIRILTELVNNATFVQE